MFLHNSFLAADVNYIRQVTEDEWKIGTDAWPIASGATSVCWPGNYTISGDRNRFVFIGQQRSGATPNPRVLSYAWDGRKWALTWSVFSTSDMVDSASRSLKLNFDGSRMVNSGRIYTRTGESWNIAPGPTSSSGQLLPAGGISGGDAVYEWSRDGNYLIVGGPQFTNTLSNEGRISVYFFNGSSWTLQQNITPPSPQASGNFGSGVSLNADATILTTTACVNGWVRVYVYTRSGTTWTLRDTVQPTPTQFRFAASTGGWPAWNGVRVNLSGNEILVFNVPSTFNTNVHACMRLFYNGTTWVEGAVFNPTIPSHPDVMLGAFRNKIQISDDLSLFSVLLTNNGGTTGEQTLIRTYQYHDGVYVLLDSFGIEESNNSYSPFLTNSETFNNNIVWVNRNVGGTHGHIVRSWYTRVSI